MLYLDTSERLNDAPLTISREAKDGQEKTPITHEYNNVRFNAGAAFSRRSKLQRRQENNRRDAYGRQYQVLQRGAYTGHTRDPQHRDDFVNARRTPGGNDTQIHAYSADIYLHSVHTSTIFTDIKANEQSIYSKQESYQIKHQGAHISATIPSE